MGKKIREIEALSREEISEIYKAYDQKRLKKIFKKEGRKIKTLPPISLVSPYIMVERNESSNFFKDKINVEKIEDYIHEKQKNGMPNFSLMHVLIASYIRTVSQKPAINRFIRGQRPWARDHIEVCLTIKKEMTLESPDTVIKAYFRPDATVYDVYNEFNTIVEQYRNEPGGEFDETANFFRFIPGVFLKFVIHMLKTLDYFNLMPRFISWLSPFHGSFFITSMGSLGIPVIYHHLYNFGNLPLFMSFGAKYRENELASDGSVKRVPYVDFTLVMDERICDGFYYASAFRYLKSVLRNPSVLDNPPEVIVKDIK
ncbi:MAG: hypothetical protein PUB34_06355 [Clostridia bacterium]|nr:hypothetical protein [Clostridia bacterium]